MKNSFFLFFATVAAFAYTFEVFFGKLGLNYSSKISLLTYRYIILAVILALFSFTFHRKEMIESFNKYTILYSSLIGICSVVGAYLLYFLMMSENFSIILPVVEPIIIIISCILGIFYFKEPFNYKIIIGIILSIVGIYFIVTANNKK